MPDEEPGARRVTHDLRQPAQAATPAATSAARAIAAAKHAEREARAEDQEQRALDAIKAISEGSHPGLEAFTLSNRFTDDLTSRLGGRILRIVKRRPR